MKMQRYGCWNGITNGPHIYTVMERLTPPQIRILLDYKTGHKHALGVKLIIKHNLE